MAASQVFFGSCWPQEQKGLVVEWMFNGSILRTLWVLRGSSHPQDVMLIQKKRRNEYRALPCLNYIHNPLSHFDPRYLHQLDDVEDLWEHSLISSSSTEPETKNIFLSVKGSGNIAYLFAFTGSNKCVTNWILTRLSRDQERHKQSRRQWIISPNRCQ